MAEQKPKVKLVKSQVLALGEGTNTHILSCEKEFESEELPNDSFRLLLKDTGVVAHEEHDRIVLTPGQYVKTPQQEWNPFQQRASNVYD